MSVHSLKPTRPDISASIEAAIEPALKTGLRAKYLLIRAWDKKDLWRQKERLAERRITKIRESGDLSEYRDANEEKARAEVMVEEYTKLFREYSDVYVDAVKFLSKRLNTHRWAAFLGIHHSHVEKVGPFEAAFFPPVHEGQVFAMNWALIKAMRENPALDRFATQALNEGLGLNLPMPDAPKLVLVPQ